MERIIKKDTSFKNSFELSSVEKLNPIFKYNNEEGPSYVINVPHFDEKSYYISTRNFILKIRMCFLSMLIYITLIDFLISCNAQKYDNLFSDFSNIEQENSENMIAMVLKYMFCG